VVTVLVTWVSFKIYIECVLIFQKTAPYFRAFSPPPTQELDIDFFFTHPYSSWEKGTNENTNGLLRQYFPKGTDFNIISDDTISTVENELNNRPRKCLNYKSPIEIFNTN